MAYTFTKNFDNIMLGMCGYVSTTATINETNYLLDDNCVSKTMTGTYSAYPGSLVVDQGISGLYPLFNNYSLTVGTGTGQVSYYDYTLETGSTILYSFFSTSGSTVPASNYDLKISQNLTTAILDENGKHYIIIRFQLRNDGADTKNISEICLAPRLKRYNADTSYRYLLFHEIFDAAVSVAPGDFFTYENKIELPNFRPNKPTN